MRRATRLTRTALARRRARSSTGERAARRIVRARSGGVCERCGRARATNFHHRLNRSQGGQWCPSNGLDLCGSGTTGCHGEVTVNPAISRQQGWSLRSGQNPATEPVWIAGRGRVLLAPDGTVTQAREPR